MYIDSKGKKCPAATTDTNDKGKAPMRVVSDHATASYWPLVCVVRVYTKAPALSTGATLVGLLSIYDSNHSCVAIAEDYIKRCNAHWTVAPINRAVNDKVAQDLLGKNMRFRLHMDGAVGDLTFICTKTDDVAVGEDQQMRHEVLDEEIGGLRRS